MVCALAIETTTYSSNYHYLKGKQMALTNCKECSKEISDKAASCPHCGAPTSSATADPNACIKCGTHYIVEKKPVTVSPVLLLTVPMFLVGMFLFLVNWLAALIVIGLAFMIDHFGRSKKNVLVCPKCQFSPS